MTRKAGQLDMMSLRVYGNMALYTHLLLHSFVLSDAFISLTFSLVLFP